MEKKYQFFLYQHLYFIGMVNDAKNGFIQLINSNTNDIYKLKSYYYLALINKKDFNLALPLLEQMIHTFNASEQSIYYKARALNLMKQFEQSKLIYQDLINNYHNQDIKISAFNRISAWICWLIERKKCQFSRWLQNTP